MISRVTLVHTQNFSPGTCKNDGQYQLGIQINRYTKYFHFIIASQWEQKAYKDVVV